MLTRVLFWTSLAALLAGVGIALTARFLDGPLGPLPGGPLRSGELVADAPTDFGFAAELQEIELGSDGRSRTVWVLVREGELYVPASTAFPPGKRWHLRALEDPAALLRIEGKRYPGALQRVEQPELLAQLGALARAKYPLPPGVSGMEQVWFFHFQPKRPS
jgi:hypothetical protein